MITKILLLKFLFVVPMAVSLSVGEPSDKFSVVRIQDKSFADLLLSDKSLMCGGIDVLEVNKTEYFLAVGTCALGEKAMTNPEKLDSAIICAYNIAKQKFSSFINQAISTQKNLAIIYSEVTKTDPNGQKKRIERIKHILDTYTKTETFEFIKSHNQQELGFWISADKTLLYSAIIYPLE